MSTMALVHRQIMTMRTDDPLMTILRLPPSEIAKLDKELDDYAQRWNEYFMVDANNCTLFEGVSIVPTGAYVRAIRSPIAVADNADAEANEEMKAAAKTAAKILRAEIDMFIQGNLDRIARRIIDMTRSAQAPKAQFAKRPATEQQPTQDEHGD